MWEWRRRIFLSNNPGRRGTVCKTVPAENPPEDPKVASARGYSRRRVARRVRYCIERYFPIRKHRRVYFQSQIVATGPHLGCQLQCHMAEADGLRAVWSTNIDGLAAFAAASFWSAGAETSWLAKRAGYRDAQTGREAASSRHSQEGLGRRSRRLLPSSDPFGMPPPGVGKEAARRSS